MCNEACLDFVATALSEDDVHERHVLEVGSYDANGSPRSILETLGPKSYLGVDIRPGPGVDLICGAEDLINALESRVFDLVVSTEMVEHVRDWRLVVINLKALVAPGGILVITTRSIGFEYHGWPYDFWRYQASDMRLIFSDFYDVEIALDPESPGVFVKARKPEIFRPADLAPLALYSVIRNKRCLNVSWLDFWLFKARQVALSSRRSVTRHIPQHQRDSLKQALPFLKSPDPLLPTSTRHRHTSPK
jgi:SAM-dependent methyltransferase